MIFILNNVDNWQVRVTNAIDILSQHLLMSSHISTEFAVHWQVTDSANRLRCRSGVGKQINMWTGGVEQESVYSIHHR